MDFVVICDCQLDWLPFGVRRFLNLCHHGHAFIFGRSLTRAYTILSKERHFISVEVIFANAVTVISNCAISTSNGWARHVNPAIRNLSRRSHAIPTTSIAIATRYEDDVVESQRTEICHKLRRHIWIPTRPLAALNRTCLSNDRVPSSKDAKQRLLFYINARSSLTRSILSSRRTSICIVLACTCPAARYIACLHLSPHKRISFPKGAVYNADSSAVEHISNGVSALSNVPRILDGIVMAWGRSMSKFWYSGVQCGM
jgi:hypothetical protein